jgi:phenylacetic acid degradation operon negative regulatory protein
MRKLLRTSDLIKLGLAFSLDVLDELKDPGGMSAAIYKQVYGWVPWRFRKHNFTQAVDRQLRTGNLEKIQKNGEIYLRLTSAGKEKIIRDFPLLFLANRRWDKKWRIVSYDITEISKSARELFRRKLKELGFGMLQDSVWISPHDILADLTGFIESKQLSEFVYVFEAKCLMGGEEKVLAAKIWKLDRLNNSYREIFEKLEYLKRAHTLGSYSNIKCEQEVKKLRQEYLQVLLSDPMLPRELLPDDWGRRELAKLFLWFSNTTPKP